uniref:ZP domain-containing protein n=1 Tax=Macrostomum lignano TaxID=282301 RepID=A0A1I8FZS0_9PLAT
HYQHIKHNQQHQHYFDHDNIHFYDDDTDNANNNSDNLNHNQHNTDNHHYCRIVNGMSDYSYIPLTAVNHATNDPLRGWLVHQNDVMQIDLVLGSCRAPIRIETICISGTVKRANILYGKTFDKPFVPVPRSASVSSDVGDLCYDIKLVAAKIGIFPLEFKSSAPNKTQYQFYLTINACFLPLSAVCLTTPTTTTSTTTTPTTPTSTKTTSTTSTTPTTTSTTASTQTTSISTSTPTTVSTTTPATTTTGTTSSSTTQTTATPTTSTTGTTTTTTSTTPKPTICPLINGLTSSTYIPSYSISGVSSDPTFGYSILRSTSGFMDIDLSAVKCRPNPVYIERICLYGNIKQANIHLKRSVTGNLVFSELSFTTTGDAMADSLCYSIGFNISAVRIAPQLVKSYDSAATNFRFSVTIEGCFEPLPSTCTAPTTTTSTTTSTTTPRTTTSATTSTSTTTTTPTSSTTITTPTTTLTTTTTSTTPTTTSTTTTTTPTTTTPTSTTTTSPSTTC